MNLIFFDAPTIRTSLLPFTYLRPLAELRVGILTIKEKFSKKFEMQSKAFGGAEVHCSFLTESYLTKKFHVVCDDENTYINGAILPDEAFFVALGNLEKEKAYFCGSELVALRTNKRIEALENLYQYALSLPKVALKADFLSRPWDIFMKNRQEIEKDFELITEGRTSQPISDKHTIVYGEENIFIEEGASIRASVLNGEKGKIYIGRNAKVEEGCIIRGAFALGEGATLNNGAKMRGDTTIGKYCKVGGEVSNSVFFSYSNKGHDGFVGNAVIGEWCNLGAATNASNLKNNYGLVRVWNYAEANYEKTELQFCGLLMGDHSKSGICTMFNTATLVGVGCNVFDEGFPPKFIPSFSWGGKEKFQTTHIEALYKTATRMMSRRNVTLSDADREILRHVFEETAHYRYWESKPLFS